MDHPTDAPGDPKPHREKEYEDPHFHDDVDFEQPDDGTRDKSHQPRRKPNRRPPPPRRRDYDD